MLAEAGIGRFEELLEQIPEPLRLKGLPDLPPSQSEAEIRRTFGVLAGRNYDPQKTVSFLGAGVYDHAIPSAVDHLALRSEFYTAYTPYQAEVAQGTLAAIFEFQTMTCELTGLDAANASMYDGASAAAEALLLARGATRASRILISPCVNPRIREVVQMYHAHGDVLIESLPEDEGRVDLAALRAALATADPPIAAVLVQQPNFFGLVEPLDEIGAIVSDGEGRRPHLVVSADPISLGILGPPASWGAETVVGDLQPLGIPAQFGGPSAGYFATRRAHIRRMPGRIAAETTDGEGRRGFTLTLQTREQHIRREKATSNICTNSALVALRATIHLSLLGPRGLRQVAEQCLHRAHYALQRLTAIPQVTRRYPGPFFREFVIVLPCPAAPVIERLYAEHGILGGVPLSRFVAERENELLVAVTEQRTSEDIDRLAECLGRVLGEDA